jgi:hypothetical protein
MTGAVHLRARPTAIEGDKATIEATLLRRRLRLGRHPPIRRWSDRCPVRSERVSHQRAQQAL